MRSLSALTEKVVLLRLLGRLGEAMDVSNQALRQARFTGQREEVALARIRRAQVLHYQDRPEDAMLELNAVIDESHTHDWFSTEAFALQARGSVHFDQGDLDRALADFRAAAELREQLKVPEDELEVSLTAISVVQSFLDERRRPGKAVR